MKFTKEFKAGLIAVIAIASFWWLFNYLKGNDLFSSGHAYYVNFDNVDGLAATKSVSINGLKVGVIKSIEPISKGVGQYVFKIKLEIDERYTFSKNSIAEVYESGLLSGKDIRIILAKDGPIAKNGDTIKGEISTSLSETLSNEIIPLKDNFNRVLNGLDSTLNSSHQLLDKNNIAQVKLLLTNLNSTVSGFKTTSNGINGLLSENDQKISKLLDNSTALVTSTNATIDKFSLTADKLNQLELQKTLSTLQTTLYNLNGVIEKVNSGEGSLGKLINNKELYDNLNQSSLNLALLLEDLKKNPKNYINISVFGKKSKPIVTETPTIKP